MLQQLDTVTEQSAALVSGETTSSSLARTALERAEKNSHLNAFVCLNPDHILTQAQAADKRRESGKPLSPIDGVPIAIKDNYLTKDYPTTACSGARPLEPDNVDATIVANLRKAGAVIFGKTNMHEWAYGATNTTSTSGPTRNPHNPDHMTGGSSGGSAAAVAAGIVAAALGSDTGGSVRIPSSACGIYGFKPSYGRASRHGVLPLSWSLDAPGPIAASLNDIAMLLPYFMGRDDKDPSTFRAQGFQPIDYTHQIKLTHLIGAGLERSKEVDKTLRSVIDNSIATVTEAEIPNIISYFAAWEAILHSEASSYHEKYLQKNPQGFSSVTRAHLEAGLKLTATEILQAQKLRRRLLDTLLHSFGDWDILVLPTLPVTAPKHGEDWQEFGGRRVTTQDSMTWFCWLGNLTGLPCVTIPIGRSSLGLPIGMMLMGKPGQDEKLLSMAMSLEKSIALKE